MTWTGMGVESFERQTRKKKLSCDAVRLDPVTALWNGKRQFFQYVVGCPLVRAETLRTPLNVPTRISSP